MELRQLEAPQRTAVCVRRACKRYGSVPVLRDFSMTVAEGTIYALLGASGCGKTTLLSCLVGRQQVDSGQVCVLGVEAGRHDHTISKSSIGYMPQDVALYDTFTIKETMLYFGWIFDRKSRDVEENLHFWLELLQLPQRNTKVKNLSGGQKRRLSLATALLHGPSLAVLDEPTVGLDPLLRDVIWRHLLHLSGARGTTIVITTHYIQEARQAHTIGLIRNGCLLAEESPGSLLRRHQSDSLEEVFVLLSLQQEQNKRSQDELPTSEEHDNEEIQRIYDINNTDYSDKMNFPEIKKIGKSRNLISTGRMSALLYKNCTSLWKDQWLMLYLFGQCLFLPTIVYYAFIGFPELLTLAVVNHDRNSSGSPGRCGGDDGLPLEHGSCELADLGCRFTRLLGAPHFTTELFSDRQLAAEAVRRGRAWGSLYFNENYTSALAERARPDVAPSDDTVEQSNALVRLDMTDFITSHYLQAQLFRKYQTFMQEIAESCGYNPKLVHLPLRVKESVYGHMIPRNIDQFGGPFIIFIVYFLGVALSTPSIVFERREGLLDRNIVAGITTLEIVLAHFLAQFVVLACQIMVLEVFALNVFQLECIGNPVLLWWLSMVVGASGMLLGFAISAFCQCEMAAALLANGCVMPLLLMSGILWPLAGLHPSLATASPWLPLTLPVEAVRSITSRGMSMAHPKVYAGFAASGGWCLLFVALVAVSIRFNRL
ncbi:ABC transporter G family member 20-like [Bacillus rossius redtenbacheri]|uniref:ABC transporter G family member 20-like n=1 Tax=Bacillus rossius redtenbacheri TaxID=93214 RepID=UPI002FDD31FA